VKSASNRLSCEVEQTLAAMIGTNCQEEQEREEIALIEGANDFYTFVASRITQKKSTR
jgi:hypothetical protein